MEKISAVYQIINTVTGDRYVGSSKDVKRRWSAHKRPSRWKKEPNKPLYVDMQKYGIDKFRTNETSHLFRVGDAVHQSEKRSNQLI